MRLTLRFHHTFGEERAHIGGPLAGPDAWDRLRLETSGDFGLPESQSAYASAATRPDLVSRANEINKLLDRAGVTHLASYGVGSAMLEMNMLHGSPDRSLTLTEFAPGTVERLQRIFSIGSVINHDLTNDPPATADLHMFHRIDTELDDEAWKSVFARFNKERILVVATQTIDLRALAVEVRNRLRFGRSTWAGWTRTKGSFEALWEQTHVHEHCVLGGLQAWMLQPA